MRRLQQGEHHPIAQEGSPKETNGPFRSIRPPPGLLLDSEATGFPDNTISREARCLSPPPGLSLESEASCFTGSSSQDESNQSTSINPDDAASVESRSSTDWQPVSEGVDGDSADTSEQGPDKQPVVGSDNTPLRTQIKMNSNAAPFLPQGLSSYAFATMRMSKDPAMPMTTDTNAWETMLGGDMYWWTSTGMANCPGANFSEFPECRWHDAAAAVGEITDDGHTFTKTAGPRQNKVGDDGRTYELAKFCLITEASVRVGGAHRFQFHVLSGELGLADGVGFTFDKVLRRKKVQQTCAVFLNQHGCICLRRYNKVTKMASCLPALTQGVRVTMFIDLDLEVAKFVVSREGGYTATQQVSVSGVGTDTHSLRSGFFCAVLTGSVTVSIC